ncbi:MAG: aryl-sulfate sulfotransferase [Planctomycetota bacterium]
MKDRGKAPTILPPTILLCASLTMALSPLAGAQGPGAQGPGDRGVDGRAARRPEGLLRNESGAFAGYTLYAPFNTTTTFLIDMEGRVVHTWKSTLPPGQSVYLLENGNLLRAERDPDNMLFHAGGEGGRIREYTWDGELVWDYSYASERYLQHHDIEPLPNGNVLLIAWDRKNADEAIDAGRNPDLMTAGELWSEHVVEVEPVRPREGNIVWEWYVWDHLIQNHDPTKSNYGDPAAHPELVDINAGGRPRELSPQEQQRLRELGYLAPAPTGVAQGGPPGGGPRRGRGPGGFFGNADWLHINSVQYNAKLDQIVLSVHNLHEIWVIDHSTTTPEAEGHDGGASGKGGDLLYRWGNPRIYGAGTAEDQQLFSQHDVRWIEEGCPGEGNILVFNNGMGRRDGAYSSVDEITPPLDDTGSYQKPDGVPFAPLAPTWSFAGSGDSQFFSAFISGAQRLKNGNTLICSGAEGRLIEVQPQGTIVWEYVVPAGGEAFGPAGFGGGFPGFPPGAAGFRVGRGGSDDDRPPGTAAGAGGGERGEEGRADGGRDERRNRGRGGPGGMPMMGGVFRATRIAPDYPGLAGRELKPVVVEDAPEEG